MLARHTALVFIITGLLASCNEASTPVTKQGFKSKYTVARAALEDGNYTVASRGYKALLKKQSALTPRLRVEYAHTLLRQGNFAEAARQAGIVVNSQDGTARLAALSVRGTADHEIARAAMAKGQRGDEVKARLMSAKSALDVVLKQGKAFDPIGSLKERRQIIIQELKQL